MVFPEVNALLFCLFAIAFLAAFVKGITGTGLGTIIVSFSTLIIDVKQGIVLTSLLSLYSGIAMMRSGPVSVKSRYYIFILLSTLVGTILGATILKHSPVHFIEGMMFVMLVVVGTLFTFDLGQKSEGDILTTAPENASGLDLVIGFLVGFLTGLTSISIPLLVLYFGRFLSKAVFRHFMVLLFIPSAFFQVTTFASNGLLTTDTFLVSLLMIPFLWLGIKAGSKVFHLISEKQFKKYLGVFLYLVALKLVLL